MTEILLAPIADKAGEQVAPRVWRKQVLKHGTLNYKGRTLKFDQPYTESLAKAFAEQAYDSVPFVLADEKNRHTMAPERARGEVVGLIPTEEGLDAILRLSEDAVKIVEDNPKFGVSVRIVENLERGDGYKAPAAIQHVLGTWDPRMTGMSPWEAVEMSTEDADTEVLDLTKGEGDMPFSKEQEERLNALLNLPEEKFAALLGEDNEGEAGDVEDNDDTETLTPEEEAELLRILNGEDEADEEEEEEPAREREVAKLSNEDESVELSALREEQANTRRELANLRWEKDRNELINKGVPPAMVDLAEPVLKSGAVDIELSNGETGDARAIVRSLLDEAAGYVDLSDEQGHQGHVEPDVLSEMHKAADAAGWEG